jgi:tetratricopeptide (TPR) repeat protein
VSFRRGNPELLLCLFLLVAVSSVYWQVGGHDFITFDDPLYVTENEPVQKGLSARGLVWAFTTTDAGNWHPLTWLSHMLDCELFGTNPRGHHLHSLLLHAANTLLLFVLLRRMTGALWRSFAAAGLFALHPLHVESVAWVAERKDVLSTLFWMLTLWAYARYAERPAVDRYLLTLSFFALGLLAKPMLVTLPFVLLLLDYWPLGRLQPARSAAEDRSQGIDSPSPPPPVSPIPRLLLEKTPFFVLAAISSLVTFLVQQQSGATRTLERYPLADRLANALVSYVTYGIQMIWPRNLAVFYPHPGGSLAGWQVLAAGILLLGVSILVWSAARRSPHLLVGWLWYLGTLAPVIGVVQVGEQAHADRYTYVPLIGLFIMISWSVPESLVRRRLARIALAVSAAGVLSSLMIVSWLQVRHWRDDTALYEHTLAVTENNYLANNNLGGVLQEGNRLEEAVRRYAEAIRIKPHYADAHFNMAMALARQGRLDEAAGHFSEVARLDPGDADAYRELGNISVRQGRPRDAIEYYSQAARLDPDRVAVRFRLGTLLARQGRTDEAISWLSSALESRPDLAEAHTSLGIILATRGQTEEAIDHFREALRLKPNDAAARSNLEKALRVSERRKARESSER